MTLLGKLDELKQYAGKKWEASVHPSQETMRLLPARHDRSDDADDVEEGPVKWYSSSPALAQDSLNEALVPDQGSSGISWRAKGGTATTATDLGITAVKAMGQLASAAGEAAEALGPFGYPVTAVVKALQFVRLVKTEGHVKWLELLLELALEGDSEAQPGTTGAIRYALSQKELKATNSGWRGLIPLRNLAVKIDHRFFKENRGEERTQWASVLLDNAMKGDPWAQEVLDELLGEGRARATSQAAESAVTSDALDAQRDRIADKLRSW